MVAMAGKSVEPEETTDVDDAAAEAAAAAQSSAQSEATARGVTLTGEQLDQIGRTAAQETHRLFEQSGAFRRDDPAPPPPPADAGSAPEPESTAAAITDDPPQKKRSWAANVCDT